jgi:hypothetical protein
MPTAMQARQTNVDVAAVVAKAREPRRVAR